MNDILQTIAENKRREVRALFPSDDFAKEILEKRQSMPSTYSMAKRLLTTPGGIIAEFKRRSPSKGEIFPMADVSQIIPQYVEGGAAAASVLTDSLFFGSSSADLAVARSLSETMPLLRKDFVISKAQIYEARWLGASSILLIVAILSERELSEFNELAHSLQMETLVEIHDIKELSKISFTPDMLGVNNRNLSSFQTDVSHSLELVSNLPKDCILVAESGMKSPEDVKRLKNAGFNGFLIGEAFMSTPNPGNALKSFIDEITR